MRDSQLTSHEADCIDCPSYEGKDYFANLHISIMTSYDLIHKNMD